MASGGICLAPRKIPSPLRQCPWLATVPAALGEIINPPADRRARSHRFSRLECAAIRCRLRFLAIGADASRCCVPLFLPVVSGVIVRFERVEHFGDVGDSKKPTRGRSCLRLALFERQSSPWLCSHKSRASRSRNASAWHRSPSSLISRSGDAPGNLTTSAITLPPLHRPNHHRSRRRPWRCPATRSPLPLTPSQRSCANPTT
jgi:hypothetical protein